MVREGQEVLVDALALAVLAEHVPALAPAPALVDHVQPERADFCLREHLAKHRLDVQLDARRLAAEATSVTRRVKKAR